MTASTRRIRKHRQGRKILDRLITTASHVQVIHYSCESFYDRVGERSPRITSIAVRNLENGSTRSFSIHAKAEIEGLTGHNVIKQYDELEKMMLDDYFKFVEGHLTDTWLHWNMRDIVYGFQAIEHRYEVLGGSPAIIPETNKVDLSSLLANIYGPNYIEQPRMASLVQKNRLTDKDFLPGEDEAIAFEHHEYFKMHLSTLRKVHVMSQIAMLSAESRLKTNMLIRDIYGLNPEAIGELLKDHWLISIFMFLATFLGLIISVFN